VYASDLSSTYESSFTYTGNDSELTAINLSDILLDNDFIFRPKHIKQIENRLVLAHMEGPGINWCEFQKYASKINSDLTTKQVILNNVVSEPNIKNPKSTFIYRGYMPGEVHSFGIVYVANNWTSPVFHIPGKSITDTVSKMKSYELDSRYLDVHNCSTSNYWGDDVHGDPLVANKVRHHRFPFRKDVNKPLVTTSTTSNTISKHRLKLVITLNPGFTPSPSYPTDTNGDAIPIPYAINYQVTGNPNPDNISGILTDTDIGRNIFVYDDLATLDAIYSGQTGQLDPTCILATNYQAGGNPRFVLTFTYDTYTATTTFNDDVSEIFGIEFSNIEKPHPDVIGFYIVRNERTDDDKLIIDNAILGPMTEFQQYKSFGLITPKKFYNTNNCGTTGTSGKTLTYHTKGIWFFNPEFQFFGKKADYDTIEVEGTYAETSVNMPTISNVDGSSCNNGNGSSGSTRGVYIEDVQAGTSYNPEVNKSKNKDDDGFDLIIGYRNTNMGYSINNTLVFPLKKNILYLNAASYKNYNNNIYYNVSVDNKIGEYLTDVDIPATTFNTNTNTNKLIYGSLVKNNTTAYSNFINRPYHKEHNNPIYFGNNTTVNNVKIFNGDAQISPLDFVSSVFYDMVVADRAKKSKIWKIVLGAVLAIGTIAATVVTAGAAAPAAVAAITALTTLGISYGVSLIVSGIKFEQFKNMIDTDYEKGLKDTVTDGGVFETVRDTIGRKDDTVRWFSDRVTNLYIESSVPFGLRSGLTSGVSDFVDSPEPYDEVGFRSYLTEKFTTLDRDQGSGRLYKGYAGAEFYDMNLDYMRFNKEKIFIHLPIEYDCCSDFQEIFPDRIKWSEQSFQEEKIDNYRVFLPNNYRDIEGEHGEITGMYKIGNSLYINTREATYQLPQSHQERVTGEIISFIGTGEFFSLPPRKIVDADEGSVGTQHKWANIKTPNGMFLVNELEGNVYLHAEKLKNISNNGMRNWFKNNLTPNLTKQLFIKFTVNFPFANNPVNPNGIGYLSVYDNRHERIILTKKDYKITQTKLSQLTLSTSRANLFMGFTYCSEDGLFYENGVKIEFSNGNYFENKSWTISYSFLNDGWYSWHSYLPSFYIHGKNNFYSGTDNKLFKHNQEGLFQTFYGVYKPFIVEYVKRDPLQTQTLESIVLQSTAKRWNVNNSQYYDANDVTFNKIIAYDGRFSTGELIMKMKDVTTPSGWYRPQIQNTKGVILITRTDRNWNINNLRNHIIAYDQSMFTDNWQDIAPQYPIDKIPNPAVVDLQKTWYEREILRDKYCIIRLKFDNFNDVNLTLNYSLETEQVSIR
jgi:hypothetical protein